MSTTIALSVVFATAVNYRRNVSMAGMILAISVGIAMYATAITLLVDLLGDSYAWGTFEHMEIPYAGVLGCAAMCGILLVIFALG